MDPTEQLLRRLALGDERSLGSALADRGDSPAGAQLAPKDDALVRLGALIAMGAATVSLRTAVDVAGRAGADDAEIVGVLVSVARVVGLARVVSVAPRLAQALGYDALDGSD